MLAFGSDDFCKNPLALRPFGRILRHVNEARAILTLGGQANIRLSANLPEKGMRRLHQDARAVARIDLAATGAAVVQVDQNGQRLFDDLVGLKALDVDQETDSAGLVFKLWIVKALLARRHRSWLCPAMRLHRMFAHSASGSGM